MNNSNDRRKQTPLFFDTSSRHLHTHWWVVASIAVLAISLLIDLHPRFTFGDSRAYLETSLRGYRPPDRSWAYGLIACWVIRVTGTLSSVLILQILAVWVSSMALALALVRRFNLGSWFGFLCVAVLMGDPLGFFWARGIMTDTLPAAGFALLAALLFTARSPLTAATGLLCLGFLICAMRSVYLPPLTAAFAASLVLTLVFARRTQSGPPAAWRAAACGLAAIIATTGYAFLNSKAVGRKEISTNYASARFLVGAWSPIISPGLAGLNLPAPVTAGMAPLTYENRLVTTFGDNGLVPRLAKFYGDSFAAEPAYRRLLRSTILDDPAALAALIARSWSDYIDPEKVFRDTRGMHITGLNSWGTTDVLPPDVVTLLEGWVGHSIPPDLPQHPSIGATWYSIAGGAWSILLSWFATIAPVFYLFVPRRHRSVDLLAILFFAFFYMAMLAVTTNALVVRYLIPLDIPLLATLAASLPSRASSPSFLRRSLV